MNVAVSSREQASTTLLVWLAIGFFTATSAAADPLAAYHFAQPGDAESGRQVIVNRAVEDGGDKDAPLDLRVERASDVRWEQDGLRLRGQAAVASDGPARDLMETVLKTDELSIEVWLTPQDARQSGPARIVTLSSDPSHRNFTIGQEGDRYEIRLRSTRTGDNGLPPLVSPEGSVRRQRTHLIFTRTRGGATTLYLDGEVVARGNTGGDLSNWDRSMRLGLGNELGGGRGWAGKLHGVAISAEAWSRSEVAERFASGVPGDGAEAANSQRAARRHFQTRIAPLLTEHCLECHDTATGKGGLVLDRQAPAFAQAIVPGDAEASPLWRAVADDSMPLDRAPLNEDDKQTLRRWLEQGATWNLEWIDPADFVHGADDAERYIRRLTTHEYVRSVQAAVGVDLTDQAERWLPPDVRADGFTNTAYNLTVDLGHIEAYGRLAKVAAQRVDAGGLAKRFGGKGRLTDKDMRGLIESMGAWILRGPLDDAEIDLYRGISTTVAAAGGDYEQAVRATVEAMLQSPRFLYRIETQNADGTASYLDDYQLASRISYILWGAPPDERLFDLARRGELSGAETLRAEVERMLADPRAVDRSRDFVTQWLHLDHLDSLRPDAERFPEWSEQLAKQMREETLAFFEQLVWEQQRPIADLLNAQFTICGPELARLYGFKPQGDGPQRYELGEHRERGGLLTQGSVLTIGGDDASMVTRGLFVMHELLRGVVNDPPPCVDTSPVPTSAGQSARMISEGRIENEACGGCHRRFEPLAFGLEKYNGIGRYQVEDRHGNALREDGDLLIPGNESTVAYQSADQLMDLLASSPRVEESLVWKLTQFALGRPLTARDAPRVRRIHQRAAASGATYQAILREIVTSPLVHE